MTEFIIERNKLESFLPVLGCEVTEEEYIRDVETGEIITTRNGEEIPIDDIGYLAHDDDDDSVIAVKDDFPSIVEELSDRDTGRKDQSSEPTTQ